ncbi:TolB family protein [candidate division KSB1 bacterium]
MKTGKSILIIILFFSLIFSCNTGGERSVNPGEYLGQVPPGSELMLFGEGIISNGLHNRDITFSPDGKEIYFATAFSRYAMILYSKFENGKWTEPETASFSGKYLDMEPFMSHDGSRIFFLSTRPPEEKQDLPGWGHQNIWAADREGNTWGEPYILGPPVCTDDAEYFPSLTQDGTLYFTRSDEEGQSIYRSQPVNSGYSEPEKLGKNINTEPNPYNSCISPDESYMLACINEREDNFNGADFYVFFRYEDDTWSKAINIGENINKRGNAQSCNISPDGKYIFLSFSSWDIKDELSVPGLKLNDLKRLHNSPKNGNSDIYWIDSSFIGSLRPEK